MSRLCTLEVNGEKVPARRGDLLLDAALMNGVDIPYDCRSGYCGTCRVRVVAGRHLGGAGSDPQIVHACQYRILSDLRIAVEDLPEIVTVPGRVAELVPRAPGVVEVCIAAAEPLHYLPGQYCSVRFRGFPARCFSPTPPLDWPCNGRLLHFHVRQLPDGRVSSALGGQIRVGHRVKLTGPFGSAFLRPLHRSQRLVLVAGGTGFAPIWAIAEAAMTELPRRALVLVVGARELASLYMIPALCRLAMFSNVTVIPVVHERQAMTDVVRQGTPVDHLPVLSCRDVVYCAGPPPMVAAVARIAAAAGVWCHSDPFEPAAGSRGATSFLARAAGWLCGEMVSAPRRAMPRTLTGVAASGIPSAPAQKPPGAPMRSTQRRAIGRNGDRLAGDPGEVLEAHAAELPWNPALRREAVYRAPPVARW